MAEKEYIEKSAIRQALYHEAFETDTEYQRWDSGCWIRYKLFENVVDALPAADVRPVKRGSWERRIDTRFGPKLNDIIICSNCKVAFSTEDTLRRSFCPNCGADMRPVTDDGQ